MKNLKNKVVIITGGAGGMGEVHSRRFIKEGAKIVIADISDSGKELADELGDNAIYSRLDVTDEDNWKKVVQEAEDTFGPVNVLVNNAGIGDTDDKIPETKLEDYRKVIDINQIGVFLGMKSVYPSMKKAENGSIVNISSASGFMGTATQVAYDASKFAVRGMTKTAAKEFAEDNIRVNSVHPGPVITDIAPEDKLNAFVEQVPLNRIGEAEEITSMVVYLASDESTYSTGSEFVVDGGILA